MKPFVIIFFALLSSCFGQYNFEVELAGSSGFYGENDTLHYWCHEPSTGRYQYVYAAGFGFGNITELSPGSFHAEGFWVECGSIGQEIITILNDTWSSSWWFNVPGDAAGTNKLFGSPVFGNPNVLIKSNESIPTAEQCWWLNSDINSRVTNISGAWEGFLELNVTGALESSSGFVNICFLGNAVIEERYNDSLGNITFGGYASGANVFNIGYTGLFAEVVNLPPGCDQGCQIQKIAADGNLLFEKYWCTLSTAEDPTAFFLDMYNRSSSQSQSPACFFAAQPAYGWTTVPLANATIT